MPTDWNGSLLRLLYLRQSSQVALKREAIYLSGWEMHPKQRPEATSKKKASRPSWILIRIFIARCRRIYWRTFGAEIRAATWDSFPWSAKWGNRMGPKKRDSVRPKFGQRSDRLHHRVNRGGEGGGGGSCMKFSSVRKIIFSARGCLPSNFL